MRKILLALVVLLALTAMLSAQTFQKGDNVASVNVGVLGGYGIPVTIGYERGIYDFNEDMGIGLGASLGLGSATSGTSNVLLTVDGRYHYAALASFDLYAGLSLGTNIACAKDATVSHFLWGIHVGSRYYFNDWLGANLQVGYGLAAINLGVCFKF